ncbi:MAG: hypothetical protein AB7K09_06075 [Planctomycetota bacterium]
MVPVVLALAFALVACGGVDYVKQGDAAAATGDWRAAESNYRMALSQQPSDQILQGKHSDALNHALDDARTRAHGMQSSGDVEAALKEVEYALTLAPGDAELVQMRTTLAKDVAQNKLISARGAADAGRFDEADKLVNEARDLTSDSEVVAQVNELGLYIGLQRARKDLADATTAANKADYVEAARLIRRAMESTTDAPTLSAADFQLHNLADPAADEVMRLVGAGEKAKAIPLAELAAELDPTKYKSLLDGLRTVHAQEEQAEFARLNGLAQTELSMFNWAKAKELLTDALTHGDSEKANAQLDYATHCMAAKEASAAKNWSTAQTELTAAIATGQDTASWAKMELDRVGLKIWRVSFRHLLVSPVKADGSAWTGPENASLKKSADALKANAAKLQPNTPSPAAIDAIDKEAKRVPGANRPDLQVRITLPDGRVVAPEAGIDPVWNPNLNSWFDVSTNQMDERKVTIDVQIKPAEGEEGTSVGMVSVMLKDLLTNGAALASGGAVLSAGFGATAVSSEIGSDGGLSPSLKVPGAKPETPEHKVTDGKLQGDTVVLQVETSRSLGTNEDADALTAIKLELTKQLVAQATAGALVKELKSQGRYKKWLNDGGKVTIEFTVTGEFESYTSLEFVITGAGD